MTFRSRPFPFLFAALLALALGSSAALAQPVVPGFTVAPYADVPDPTRMAFAADGTLYTGRDALGSGAGAGDAVRIHRVGPGGTPVVEYGNAATPDPDSVVVDVNGDLAGVGSVLVGGFVSSATGGRISEIASNEVVSTLFAATNFDNPADLVIDSAGRLLIANFANPGVSSGIFVSTGGAPTPLVTTSSQLAFIAVDSTDRIVVSAADGTIRLYDSAGVLLDGGLATGLGGGVPIAVGSLGALAEGVFAVNASGELLHIDFAGNPTVVGTDFGDTNELGFGPDGALYAAEFTNDRILRISPTPSVPAFGPIGWLLLGMAVVACGAAFAARSGRDPA